MFFWGSLSKLGSALVLLEHCMLISNYFSKWFSISVQLTRMQVVRMYQNSTQMLQGQTKVPFITARQFAHFLVKKKCNFFQCFEVQAMFLTRPSHLIHFLSMYHLQNVDNLPTKDKTSSHHQCTVCFRGSTVHVYTYIIML